MHLWIESTYTRTIEDSKKFISKHIAKGNNICTDGWKGYDYLDTPQSGSQRYRQNHMEVIFDSMSNPHST